jgi:hypothetical protein
MKRKFPWVLLSRAEYERLRLIEREADWVRKGRQISRQAALNCVPDLIRALEKKP